MGVDNLLVIAQVLAYLLAVFSAMQSAANQWVWWTYGTYPFLKD